MNNELLKNKRNRDSEEEILEIPFKIIKNIAITNNYICITLNFKNYIILRGISFKKDCFQGTISFLIKNKRTYKTILNSDFNIEFFHFYDNIPILSINIILQFCNNNNDIIKNNAFQIYGINNQEIIKNYLNNPKFIFYNRFSDWITQGRIIYGEKICDINFDKLYEDYEYIEKTKLYREIMNGNYEEAEKLIKSLISKNLFKFNICDYSVKIYKEVNYFIEQNEILFKAESEYNSMLKRIGDKNIQLNQIEMNLNSNNEKDNNIENNSNNNNNNINNINNNNNNNINNNNINNNNNNNINNNNNSNSNNNNNNNNMDIINNDNINININNEYNKMINKEKMPKARSEHCLVLDEDNNILYLFGGNDNISDLNDLWSYNLLIKKWELLSENNPNSNIPPQISFPKMVFIKESKQLLIIGKKFNSQNKNEDKFFIYDTVYKIWCVKYFENEKILNLKEEFQICYDDERNIIYLIGGRTEYKKKNNNNIIDFYSINLNTNKIENIYKEEFDFTFKDDYSRFGHCLIFDNIKNSIYIFGGLKKNKDDIIPMYRMIKYDILKKETKEIYHNINFNQLTKNHNEIKEIYGMSSFYSKKKRIAIFFGGMEKNIYSNKFIIFNLDRENFYIIPNQINEDFLISKRFYSSIVYSDKINKGYIFGGKLSINSFNIVSDDFFFFKIYSNFFITQDIIYEKFYYLYVQELINQNKIKEAFNIIKNCNFSEKKLNLLLDFMLNCPVKETDENVMRCRHRLALFLMNGIKDKI